LIDDKSRQVGLKTEKSSRSGRIWNEDKEPETDSHEVIREIVKKIMARNQAA
jgi:hypothetical protein